MKKKDISSEKTIHEKYMNEAYKEGLKAYGKLETPVGAVIVFNGKIIARGHNTREQKQDPTLHAEIIAIKKAAKKLGSWRLIDCDLYVTLEPCPMCAGALIQSRIRNLYYGAKDPKAGAVGSVLDILAIEKFNHKVNVYSGIMENKCSDILKNFFRELRKSKGNNSNNV
ncbi:tRNA adenosine(34) deaminase TadA [Pseudobacteroides cellulosolvens]|uniref:tRNA-specific adenosine deaminase n=1 Tax=Pseudobacteroides cellulosolvens ATCC 35603 = DSM 2933 TaxID=398512 RepID=A0A0L6JVM4_9FIRM|nr:tRNA adenosine(34) deaminase TadA [Pseudobacteroides cellulosolvens]KNY29685.1 CMP/dCMP deaminase zinc-binding protein [Pseudobacteroides cellulosolvens ATCC 35603 = DSM 2933]